MIWILLGLFVLLVAIIAATTVFTRMTIVRYSKREQQSAAKREAKRYFGGETEAITKFRKMIEQGADWLEKHVSEEHEITTYDGLTLRGRLYRAENARGTVICVHGFRSRSTNDFSFIAGFYYDLGFNVLLYDRRGHGDSDGKYITYGVLDRFDLRDWILKVNTLTDSKPVILDGVSMGAATVCMASGLELPANVKIIVADCPYTSPAEQIVYTMKLWLKLPKFPFLYIVSVVSKLIAGFGFFDCDSETEIKKNHIPLFLAHGDCDNFVCTEMGKRIYEACPAPKELFIVKDAGHAMSIIVATDEYHKRLCSFIDRYI